MHLQGSVNTHASKPEGHNGQNAAGMAQEGGEGSKRAQKV
jgi:hypothetical protein